MYRIGKLIHFIHFADSLSLSLSLCTELKKRVLDSPLKTMASLSSWFFTTLLCFLDVTFAGDPFVFFDWTVSYTTASPLGVKQKVGFPSLLHFYSVALFFSFIIIPLDAVKAKSCWHILCHELHVTKLSLHLVLSLDIACVVI